MKIDKSTGEILRENREKKGLLLRQVAAKLDIDTAILSKIERSERKATKEQIIKLAKILDLKEEDILVQYLSEKILYEIKDTTSKDIFSLIPFRSKNLSIKKWNSTDEIIYCIIEGSKNSWINLHGYINSFENESKIKTEDWNDEVWEEFLRFLDTKLLDYGDV